MEKSRLSEISLLLDIQLLYNQLTKTEKKIANFVMQNPDQVIFMSITELSDACKVADASVYRFCRTIGVKGYQEFKMKLSLSMSAEADREKEEEVEVNTVSLQKISEDILEGHIRSLKETQMLLKWDEVEKIVGMMEKAECIYFFGIGDSLLAAMEARNRFARVMKKVICVNDPHMQAMKAALSGSDDLVFLFSYSGATKDIIYVAKILREVGAKVVAITHFLKSPLMGYVDGALLCGSNENPFQGGSLAGKLGQLYLIDILYQEYCRRNLGVSTENNQKTTKAVVEKLF
ncbi:MAG: MurR/RpiR family transcriptional regulator [Ruminococcus flavefaciens]|nr:MurR/RpiR family transcriptional regulator [Ruminococcus flavefaciens]